MPDKPLTIVTYAASASLAAVALVYFFNPSYLFTTQPGEDGGGSLDASLSGTWLGSSMAAVGGRRRAGSTVVGLINIANDCFINSVLQALAGLGSLRMYLIREIHRRDLELEERRSARERRHADAGEDGDQELDNLEDEEHEIILPDTREPVPPRKAKSMLKGETTRGLKAMLDRLNERPLRKKSITTQSFVGVIERAFNTRVNRNQQDAQELLQLVAERLAEEYAAGKLIREKLRKRGATRRKVKSSDIRQSPSEEALEDNTVGSDDLESTGDTLDSTSEESGFPMEGQTRSEIECQHCHFIPKSAPSSFVMLTLTVPQKPSSSLSDCIDGLTKRELIDDYRCDRCRLDHAISTYTAELNGWETANSSSKSRNRDRIRQLECILPILHKTINGDPEKPPETIQPALQALSKDYPKRQVARSVQITKFPKILVLHLSRSIFDPKMYSSKNTAKVAFPERMPMGGLRDRRNYVLLGVITHKGTHNSGHYEAFRRQHLYMPYANPVKDPEKGPYARTNPRQPSANQNSELVPETDEAETEAEALSSNHDHFDETIPATPQSPPLSSNPLFRNSISTMLTRDTATPVSLAASPTAKEQSNGLQHSIVELPEVATAAQGQDMTEQRQKTVSATPIRPTEIHAEPQGKTQPSQNTNSTGDRTARRRRKRPQDERWWRISDEKVKECRTQDVLGMQKEVYMLFYEMEEDTEGPW